MNNSTGQDHVDAADTLRAVVIHEVRVRVLSAEEAKAIITSCWASDATVMSVAFSRRFVRLESYVKEGESAEQAVARLDALVPQEMRSAKRRNEVPRDATPDESPLTSEGQTLAQSPHQISAGFLK